MKSPDKLDEIIAELRGNRLKGFSYEKRDLLLSRLHKAWQPLITHIQNLAETHLPDDRRLRMEFTVKEDFGIDLKISMEKALHYDQRKNAECHWAWTDGLTFYRAASNSQTLALISRRLTLSDVFFTRAGNPYALACVDIGMTDEKLKNSRIHPDHMDDAKALLEYWLAKQISLDFDPERLQPVSALEITMVRKDPAP